MKHLLDGIVQSHSHHPQVHAWRSGKQIVLCSNHRSSIGLTMEQARDRLEKFAALRRAERIPDDLPALESRARTHDQVTDHYLADLAAKHGFRLATLDTQMNHPSTELIL
jgi:predicted nucleic acid-binding protein